MNVKTQYFLHSLFYRLQDHDDLEFMARKLKEEYEKWGLTMNLENTKYMYRRRKRKFKI